MKKKLPHMDVAKLSQQGPHGIRSWALNAASTRCNKSEQHSMGNYGQSICWNQQLLH